MAVRAPRRRPQTPRADRYRLAGLSGGEVLAYLTVIAVCLALAWALVTIDLTA